MNLGRLYYSRTASPDMAYSRIQNPVRTDIIGSYSTMRNTWCIILYVRHVAMPSTLCWCGQRQGMAIFLVDCVTIRIMALSMCFTPNTVSPVSHVRGADGQSPRPYIFVMTGSSFFSLQSVGHSGRRVCRRSSCLKRNLQFYSTSLESW